MKDIYEYSSEYYNIIEKHLAEFMQKNNLTIEEMQLHVRCEIWPDGKKRWLFNDTVFLIANFEFIPRSFPHS